jgi:protein-disulfide isomerase
MNHSNPASMFSFALKTFPVVWLALWQSAYADPGAVGKTTPTQETALEQAIERYIRTHPQVIEQSLHSLEAKRQEDERQRIKAALATRQDELLHDEASPVSGNPSGEITLIEFFDYRCGFCKRTAGAVTQLQKEDHRVRVVYKDLPILGEASELAAKAALASWAQGKHQAFHEAILASKNDLNRDELLHIAAEVGLDTNRLGTDMARPEWQDVIERNRILAKEIGITGTPGFIVGTELVPGMMDLKGLKEFIARSGNGK